MSNSLLRPLLLWLTPVLAFTLAGGYFQALARAKQRGRDQFVLFTPDEKWQAQVNSRLTGDKLIREALAHGRFVLFAQPILDLKTDTICQYEILLRMLDENDELMAPASFLDTAERFGLIRSIDRWVVRQAIQLMGRQHKTGNERPSLRQPVGKVAR